MRTRRYWVRLSEEEAGFVEEVKRRIGAPTRGEALRFIVQYMKWITESEFYAIPKEVVGILRGGGGSGGREGK